MDERRRRYAQYYQDVPEERIHVRRKRKRRRKRTRIFIRLFCRIGILLLLIFLAVRMVRYIKDATNEDYTEVMAGRQLIIENDSERPDIIEDYIDINEYSRPGEALPEVNAIFIHYTANKGTSAEQNRSYFNSLAETKERSASTHFVIGYDGKIIQCIPLEEIAYGVKGRNYDSVSIECCYRDESGQFTQETYDALIELTGWLMKQYSLTPDAVLRHYDAGGKKCPLYYVEHEDAWEQLKRDIEDYIQ